MTLSRDHWHWKTRVGKQRGVRERFGPLQTTQWSLFTTYVLRGTVTKLETWAEELEPEPKAEAVPEK